jgi:AMMECR1 domain-containing protein
LKGAATLTPALCLPLARALTQTEKARLRSHVRRLLAWQQTLEGWPRPLAAPDATVFVTIYAAGTLRGCFGCSEGKPAARLTRAFLRAIEDSRYGFVQPEERDDLTAVISYPVATRPIEPERVHEQLEAGSEGLGVVEAGRAPVLILPHVARDLRLGPRELLGNLLRKANRGDWTGSTVLALRTEDIVVRSADRTGGRRAPVSASSSALQAAATWLGRLVSRDGAVAFALDPRKRVQFKSGPMHHGRAAVLIRALDAHGGHPTVARRARAWLQDDIRRALAGHSIEGWPVEPAMTAGTLALAHTAGIDLTRELLAVAEAGMVESSAWHAAQVIAALGHDAPERLWRRCLQDLHTRPWAPWTVLAARSREALSSVTPALRALVASIRRTPPHEGGCAATPIPETALTALVVEALDGIDDIEARESAARACSFLRHRQLLGEAIPAPLDPTMTHGAFAASPIANDLLRCDIVAHALLALHSRSAPVSSRRADPRRRK